MDFDPNDQEQVRAKVERMLEGLDEAVAQKKLEPMEAYRRLKQYERELAQEMGIDPYLAGKIVTQVMTRARDIFKGILYP